MITARPQKSLKVAKEYFREHLVQGDYYTEGSKIEGYWFGKGAVRLGLNPDSPVTEEAYLRLCENQHPLTGEQLTVRKRVINHRVFHDFVIAPPKSVSIMAITLADDRITAAHHKACRLVMREMEKIAATRVRQGGQRSERVTGEIVAAAFTHESSRSLDPQLHTHFLLFNATFDPVEKRWKALETTYLFEHITFFTEVYRSILAIELREMGYRLRNTANGFEIAGVSSDIIHRFSKRRRVILAEEQATIEKEGGELTNNDRALLARTTRDRKLRNISNADLIAYQRSQLTPQELAGLTELMAAGTKKVSTGIQESQHIDEMHDRPRVDTWNPKSLRPDLPNPAARESIDFAIAHVFERRSAVSAYLVLTEALKHGRGSVTLPDLELELAGRTELIAVEGMLTTTEMVQLEKRMIAIVNRGVGRFRGLNTRFHGSRDLNSEQRHALGILLHCPDQVVSLRGGAGTGKSHLLAEVVTGVKERHEVMTLAPSAGAEDALREAGIAGVGTVQLFLADPEFQHNARGKVLVVDEAGLLSTRQMVALLEFTQQHHGRLVLSGDTRQHSGIEAGDALRILERQSSMRVAGLRRIKRQINRDYRQAIAEIADGKPRQGLRRLDELGAVLEIDDGERYRRLASEYVGSIKAKQTALVVSPTWREIEAVTREVRAKLKADGLLKGAEVTVPVHHGLKWTRAEKRDLPRYRRGMVLTFHRGTKDFEPSQWGEVLAVESDRLQVRRMDGKQVEVTRKQAGCFDVAESENIPVLVGERLLIQASRKEERLFNGQIVTVKAVKRDGRIKLDDGRTIPGDFRQFRHGYGVTSFGSQGRSVDHVYVAVDSKTVLAANQNQFYVSVSRGRKKVMVFTDDKQFLYQAVNRPGARLSALELLQSARRKVATEESIKEHKKARVRI